MFESFANTLFDGEIWINIGEGGSSFFEWEAESDKGVEGFVAEGLCRGGGNECFTTAIMRGEADFVAEVDDNAFGGFFANTTGLGNESGIIISDSVADFFGGAEAENAHGGFGADTINRDEHLEKFLCGETEEAIEIFSILADGVISVKLDGIVDVDRFDVGRTNGDFIADAVDIDNDGVHELFGDKARNVRNHDRAISSCRRRDLGR